MGSGNAFMSFIGKKAVCQFDDSWAIGTVQSINVDFRQRASVTRTPAPDAQYPTKSLPFSIVWEDNTDSIVNLQTLTTYVRDFTNGAHRQNVFGPSAADDARISPRNAAINGAAVPLPNPIPHSSGCSAVAPRQAPAQAGHHMPAPAARPPPGAGIFAGLHSYPGDLVDNLTLNGGFAFLEDLQDTNNLWTLRDVRMPRIAPKGEAQRVFAACSLLVLKLADRYPAQSLPQYIIRVVFHFLPALLMPCARKGRPAHIIQNAKKFQSGEWQYLWRQAVKEGTKQKQHLTTKHASTPPAPPSIRARASYATYCAKRGAFSKANQAITSDLTPTSDPANIDTLRAKHPTPTHPARDPTTISSRLWPRKTDLTDYWTSEDGQEYINKWFSTNKILKYFRTRSPVGAADVDGWRARETIAFLFARDEPELHALLRKHAILPYLTGDFHITHIEEYAGGLLIALQKPVSVGGGIRPILCGDAWRRCFASLAANATQGSVANIFTSTYDNFIQFAGLKDGASHCAKLLTIMYDNLDSDAQDPDVIIKVDISNAFNVLCRYLTLDVLSGTASRDYASGLKFGDSIETSCDTLRNMFPYFQAMRTCTSTLRYYDWFGQVHTAQSKTGGQQGDPLEMTVFNLSIHRLWGRVLKQHPLARALAYADDGYIHAKLSVGLKIYSELQHIFHEDAGLEFNQSKINILVKGVSADAACAAAQRIIAQDPTLTHLAPHIQDKTFSAEGYVGLGVPLGTDTFVQDFVKDKIKDIINDVDKLDAIEDGFIHYQLLRFCQATRLQYLNSHIILHNQNALQQQHADFKITDALIKKGAKQSSAAWRAEDRDWVNMVLHLPHAHGGFGVQSNQITRHAAFYTTTARFVAWMGRFSPALQRAWIPTARLDDSSTWVSPPLSMLKEIHHRLLADYNCEEDTQQSSQAAADSQDAMSDGAGAGGVGGAALQPQQQQQPQQQPQQQQQQPQQQQQQQQQQ